MPSRRSGAAQQDRAALAVGGRPHHLSSVVHHFLSDVDPDPAPSPACSSRVVVTGPGGSDLVARAGEGLGGSTDGIDWLVLDESALDHLEGLVRNGGTCITGSADLVWCLPLASASALSTVQILGRWVRALGCRRVEILLAGSPDVSGVHDLTPLKRLAGLVAPGVPVGFTVADHDRWAESFLALARRFHGIAESGLS